MVMEPLEMQGVSSGPGEGAGAAQRSRTCSSLAVLLPLAAVLAAGLVLMLADATAAPDNVVQRAREILIAELRVRTRPANLVVRDFSQTLVDTARGLYRTIEQEAQKVDEHVLLLAGSASRYELMTLTHLEFFYVSRSCMDSANARVHMGKFQLKMKAAALDSAIIYRPSNSLFSRKAPCGAEDFVGQTLLSEPIAARMLLDARYFAGDLRLFQEVQRTIHSWLDLEMAEVAMNHSDITESDLDRWGKNGTMREFLVGEMGSWFIGLELAGRISDMRKGLNVAQRWSVKLQIWRPLLSFVFLAGLQASYPDPPPDVPSLLQSNTEVRLDWLQQQGIWAPGLCTALRDALRAAMTTRALAQSWTQTTASMVCFGCEGHRDVFKVPDDLQPALLDGMRLVLCLDDAWKANLPPNC